MSNKRKLVSILGICAATVLASGGSIFLTDTGLSMISKDPQITQQTESGGGEKETEMPITVEQFTKTKDSFVVSAKKTKPEKESESETEKKAEGQEGSGTNSGASNNGSSSDGNSGTSGSSGTSGNAGSGIKYDENGGYYDDSGNYYDGNGGYYAPNGNYYNSDGTYSDPYGNWYDGSGGYYDPSGGYHKGTYDPGSSSSGDSSGSGSSGGSSSGGSSSGGSSSGWDDSYMLYDINQRYVSADELSGWSSSDLAKLRNEIFARHGRIFTSQKWIDYFAQKSWYVPTYDAAYFDDNMDSFLNDYEWKNLNTILKLEDALG